MPAARLPPIQEARGCRRCCPHGDLAGGRSARLPRRVGGGKRLAAACASPAGPARAGARSRLAGLPRGLHRARGRRHRREPGSSPPSRPSSGGDSGCRTWRCSASLSRGPRSWLARRSRRACAASTRRRRQRSRARPRSRSRARGPAASWSPRARPCATTSERSSGVTGSPSSRSATGAATCSPSVGPSTARCTSGGAGGRRRRRCWRLRSRTSPAHARRGRGLRWSGSPS